MKYLTTITLMALLIATAIPALAQSGQAGPPPGERAGGPGGPGGGPMEQILDGLDLDAGQAEQVRSILEEHRAGELGKLQHRHRALRRELERLVLDPDASEEAVAQAAARFSAQEEPIALARHRMAVDLAAVLTPEQMTDLAQQLRRGPAARRRHAS